MELSHPSIDMAARIADSTAPKAPDPKPTYDDSKAVEFPVPPYFLPPDNAEPGKQFEALGTFKMKDNGTMCIVAVDGSPVTKGEKTPPPPEKPPESMQDAMKKVLPSTGLPA